MIARFPHDPQARGKKMGYVMSTMKSSFAVKAEDVPNVINALREEFNIRSVPESFNEALELCRFQWVVDQDEDGNIYNIEFDGLNMGNETQLFQAIAPFVEDESFIQMYGEGAEIWKWAFQDGKCTKVQLTDELFEA